MGTISTDSFHSALRAIAPMTHGKPPAPSRLQVLQWGSLALLVAVALGGWLVESSPSGVTVIQTPAAAALDLPDPNAVPIPGSVFESTDKSSQIARLPGWVVEEGLNPSAQIQAANPEAQIYLIVLSQNKADLGGITKEEHSELARQVLTSQLSKFETMGPSDTLTQVSGYPAIQHTIYGSLNDINVVYLHTTVETPNKFVQILSWTPPADFARNEPQMQQIVQSFREKS
ncbi:hypothetical protein ACQ4M4_03295 [Leptolyngbya sp. AN02str]|uniref:hypothetical protein n=1 Tax=Leptolyngbya sp. AN02str TaxID=3423363 RepID=UPI003D310C43